MKTTKEILKDIFSWKPFKTEAQKILSRPLSSNIVNPLNNYDLIDDEWEADESFEDLKDHVYQQYLYYRGEEDYYGFLPKAEIFWEAGKVQPGRPYFFVKRKNERGILCERSGLGWIFTFAERIVSQDMFLRSEEPWDMVVVYKKHEEKKGKKPRFRYHSLFSGGEIITPTLYHSLISRVVFNEELKDF